VTHGLGRPDCTATPQALPPPDSPRSSGRRSDRFAGIVTTETCGQTRRGSPVRRLFTADASGLSRAALRWGQSNGQWRHLARNVYGEGSAPPSARDLARASVLAHGHVARDDLAGVLLGLDAVVLMRRPLRRYLPPPQRLIVVEGVLCGN